MDDTFSRVTLFCQHSNKSLQRHKFCIA